MMPYQIVKSFDDSYNLFDEISALDRRTGRNGRPMSHCQYHADARKIHTWINRRRIL